MYCVEQQCKMHALQALLGLLLQYSVPKSAVQCGLHAHAFAIMISVRLRFPALGNLGTCTGLSFQCSSL